MVVNARVPQGYIPGPLPFLVNMNDIVDAIGSQVHLFADDTSLHIIVDNLISAAETLQYDIDKVSNWVNKRLVILRISNLDDFSQNSRPFHPMPSL